LTVIAIDDLGELHCCLQLQLVLAVVRGNNVGFGGRCLQEENAHNEVTSLGKNPFLPLLLLLAAWE
jgi:hypothetical protein